MSVQIGIDIGGTFTDVVLSDSRSGSLQFFKVPSTKPPEVGILNALSEIQTERDVEIGDVTRLIHGSTVATNALLEGKWAKTALITTAGFRDVLEIGRQHRHSIYDLNLDRPIPVVPRERRFGVSERVDSAGEVVVPLNEGDLEALIPQLANCDAVAVCFLFSYLRPEHEHRVRDILREKLNIPVICSSDVLPEYREYERCSTTVINTALRPIVGSYIDKLDQGISKEGFSGSFEIMQSNGGLVSADIAQEHAESLLYSGPAGGVAAASFFASQTGMRNLITFDMGGTSSDISLVSDCRVLQRSESSLGGYQVRVPMADIHSVGAGGGSLAWIDSGGALRVGPQSAGSVPGPACYGEGTHPAVTDAQLVLGRFDPAKTLGSRNLLLDRAQKAIDEHVATPLGMTIEEAAVGILEIADAHMERAIRVISVERGHDPRDYALLAFGGGGPLHGCSLAEKLGINAIMIPKTAGVLSALGMLMANVRRDRVQTILKPTLEIDAKDLLAQFDQMTHELQSELETESGKKCEFEASVELRYRGQAYEIELPIEDMRTLTQEGLFEIEKAFHEEHRQLYGYAMQEHPTELVNLRLVGEIEPAKPQLPKLVESTQSVEAHSQRTIRFSRELALECPVYDREDLQPNWNCDGPVLIEGTESTILVHPGWKLRVDEFGTIFLERQRAES